MRHPLALLLALICGCGDAPPAPPPATPASAVDAPEAGAMLDETIAPVERGSPLVRFIAIPGCPLCDKISTVIAGHKARRPKLKTDRYSSMSFAGRKYLREQRLGSHGVVVYDRDGQIVWKNNGHNLDEAGLAAAVERVRP